MSKGRGRMKKLKCNIDDVRFEVYPFVELIVKLRVYNG